MDERLEKSLEEKLSALEAIITKYDKACVAFSGGADSALLLSVSSKLIPTLALTMFGPLNPRSDLDEAMEFTMGLENVDFLFSPFDPLDDEAVRSNSPERCYHCKKKLFEVIKSIAEDENCDAVFDGTNLDDLDDYRPGIKAAKEEGVVSPFIEAGITKTDIYNLSKYLGLSTQNKPPSACLATRIPTGETLTEEKLKKVEEGEKILKDYGFGLVRLRLTDGTKAVIECGEEDFPLFDQHKDGIRDALKDLEIELALDKPRLYKRGGMNAGL